MKIEIESNTIRLTGKHGKAIRIYHNEDEDRFLFEVCQNGTAIGCLPMVTFCKSHTICHNTLPIGKSFID